MNLSEKLKNGHTIYGTCIVSTSPVWSKSLKDIGLDFVFIDTEHIPINRNELTLMCQTYSALGISPVIRIPSPDPFQACMAKDAGAIGVIAPYIETTNQVKELVGATKYRPLKGQRLRKILDGIEIPEPELLSYLEKYNPGSLCIINIESRAAFDNLDQLLSVPGLDAIIIGPHDLSINIGLPEQYEHPEFEEIVKEIILKSKAMGIATGIHFPGNPKLQIKWMKEGLNIVLHSSDLFLFSQKLKQDLNEIKSAAGKKIEKTEGTYLTI